MHRLLIATLVVLVVVARPVSADEASHRQSAAELMQLLDLEEIMMAGVDTALDQQIQANPTMLPYRDVVQTWAKSFLNWDVVGPRMIDLYVANFTEQELREITAFYKTPTGQKALGKLADIMREGGVIGQKLAEEHQAELEAMIRTRAMQLEEAAKQGAGAPAEKPE